MKVLMELRPAFEGHSGIPQETRLLFRALAQLPGMELHGLLQTGGRLLAPGLPADPRRWADWPEARRIDRLSRTVVSVDPDAPVNRLAALARSTALGVATLKHASSAVLGIKVPLGHFDATRFTDFIWRALFAWTLPAADLPLVTQARFRVGRLPWSAAHRLAGLTSRLGHALYARLDTRGYDVFLAETPYPGRITPPTQLVVRYHDAFPLLMPHTIIRRGHHRQAHYEALRRNVRDGAWFACVSEATRRDLLSMFPEAEPRAVTIPNMVSHRYRPEAATPEQLSEVLQVRASPLLRRLVVERRSGWSARAKADETPSSLSTRQPDGFLLMVSTLEPRKNHLGLIAAWEQLRALGHPALQLVLVGATGWDHQAILQRLAPWAERGQVHLLHEVPATELRRLYGQARITVCPSFGEGFGFSGVEAMRSGGIVAASDLPVHREVYGEAAEYFNPYSAADIARTLQRLLSPAGEARRAQLRALGSGMAERYLPEAVRPQWQQLLRRLPSTPHLHTAA